MQRFRAVTPAVAAVVLLSLLLTACRVTEVPATTYPQVGSYPGPQPQVPTSAPATRPATLPAAPTVTIAPNPAPTQATGVGEVAFTQTILHTGEVGGEVSPCG